MLTNPKVVILGSTGMIGNGVTKYLGHSDFEIVEVNRRGFKNSSKNQVIQFDATSNSYSDLFNQLEPESVVINLIGVIRHKIKDDPASHLNAKMVNSTFPAKLVTQANNLNIRVIQIATDCIYSGDSGRYTETSVADPSDFYGLTKLQGEIESSNLLTLRVSVIGHELFTNVELLDWVLAHPHNARLKGFDNHFWNGITTLHFAKILESEIKSPTYGSGTFHVVPGDAISKYQLIKEITRSGGRTDLVIERFIDAHSIDRTLATNFDLKNGEIWRKAGYSAPPSIRMMLREYFNWEDSFSKRK